MVKAFDFALLGFEEERKSFASESDGEDNYVDDMSKLCDEISPSILFAMHILFS